MSRFEWKGNLGDDCHLVTSDGFGAHVEQMDDNEWYCSAWYETGLNGHSIFHSTEDNVCLLTGDAARNLCELIIDAERYRRSLSSVKGLE